MTVSRSDAMAILTLVSACHRRTAPRIDDLDVARATADTWAELFNVRGLAMADLVAAVKLRATTERDAPEPAEIIAVARKIRRDRQDSSGTTEAERARYEAERAAHEALCESKSIDAAELAEIRRARESAPAIERPRLHELVGGIANRKGVE